jgi:DnaK suppressor protein
MVVSALAEPGIRPRIDHARPVDRRAHEPGVPMLMRADAAAVVAEPGVAEPGVAEPGVAELRTEQIRDALGQRLAELRAEHADLIAQLTAEDRGLLLPDAGDDVVDIGTKAFAREQEMSLANAVLERIEQVERALERLAASGYGDCEACARPIPAARLAAYPSATLCVSCKERTERR